METYSYDDLINHCKVRGASDEDDFQLFSASDVIERNSDPNCLTRIKHNHHGSKILHLRLNDFTNRIRKRLCFILRQNNTLEELHIKGRHSRPVPVLWLCVGMQINTSLKALSMSNVRLGGATQLNALGPFLTENPSLEKLALSRCRLGPDDVERLSEHLMRRSAGTLEELNLDENPIGDQGLDNLVIALDGLKSVKRLMLRNVGIGERGAASLAGLLSGEKSAVEELDISGNTINAGAASHLINSLKNNTKLGRLKLGEKNSGEGWTSILRNVLQLVCDGSSVSNTLKSNHTLSSLGELLCDPLQLRWNSRLNGRRDPLEAIFDRCLGADDARLLHSSLCLNRGYQECAFKARQKIVWRHFRGDFNVGESPIDTGAMPRVLAWVGCDPHCGNLFHLQEDLPLRSAVDATAARLGALYRVLRARPDLFQDSGLANRLRVHRRGLA